METPSPAADYSLGKPEKRTNEDTSRGRGETRGEGAATSREAYKKDTRERRTNVLIQKALPDPPS